MRGKQILGLLVLFFLSGPIVSLPVGALTLAESRATALQNNPAVAAARRQLDAAAARLGQALGSFLPTVKLDANYGKSYTQPSTVQITVPTTAGAITQDYTFGTDADSTVSGYTASLSQPLFVAALFPGYQIARRSVDHAREEYRRVVQQTNYDVAAAYYGLLSAEKLLKLSEESFQLARSHLDQVSTMVKTGAATRADLLRAEVQAANSEVALTRAKHGLELAIGSFNNMLGSPIDQPIGPLTDTAGLAATLPDYQQLKKEAWSNRPDWRQFLTAEKIAEENVRVAQSAYFPSLFLNGQTGNSKVEYPSFKSDVNSWSVVGVASWTLFDGLVTQNRISEAAAGLAAQQATAEKVRNGIALEVRAAYLRLKSALEAIGPARKAVDFAEESEQVSSLRFSSGLGTNIEVIDAQVALTQAQNNYLQAQFDVELAKARIDQVAGRDIF